MLIDMTCASHAMLAGLLIGGMPVYQLQRLR